VSWRSGDEETHIGAVLVDTKNRLISAGYNGPARGLSTPATRPEKYPFMVHAEQNAILFSQRDLEGCRLYVTSIPPCSECAKSICQVGIKEVIIVNPIQDEAKKQRWGYAAVKDMFTQSGIILREINVQEMCYA
jgi:dCMP deaminase